MPIEIFAKFSDSSRRVLITAQKIAEENNMGVNSEHLLIALATVPDTYAYRLLHQFTINVEQIRLILRLRGPESNLKSGLSAYAKKIIELAAAQAANFGNSRVDAEHLLLSITCLEDCLAYQIITRIGINPVQIRSNLMQLFSEISNLDEMITKQLAEPIRTGQIIAPPLREIDEPEAKKSKTPALDYFGTNLTDLARQGKLDPVIGRGQEIGRVIQILARKTKNNPVLIGDPGVGKTAIIDGLACQIAKDEVPSLLKNRSVFSLDLTLVVAGTMYRGQFEERMKRILVEAKTNPEVILFIDEIHTLAGSGNAEGSLDAANILKPALARGEIRLIGATTAQEYRKYIERDAALERRLQVVTVAEPTIDETIQILQGLRQTYENFHNVKVTDQAIEQCVRLAKRYITNRFLPDKAIDLLDETAAAVRLQIPANASLPDLATLEQHLTLTLHEKELALKNRDRMLVAQYQSQEQRLTQKLHEIRPTVDGPSIAKTVSQWTGVPLTQMTTDEAARLVNLEKQLSQHLLGQDKVIKSVADVLRRAKTRVSDPKKPFGSFLFLGPSGVGKTELARVLATLVFGHEESLIKIDMSEYMERHTVSGLIGAPAGYVGYEEAGKLTETVRRSPYAVVLFDEVEKAHPEVLNILLQILEDGYVTDTKGRRINFRSTIIIMTSNIGLKELTDQAAIGFQGRRLGEKKRFISDFETTKKAILKKVKDILKPELLNRLDYIAVFEPLTQSTIKAIAELHIKELTNRLLAEGYIVYFDQKVIQLVADRGFDPHYGARPIKRAIAELIEGTISLEILKGKVEKGVSYKVSVDRQANLLIRKHSYLTPPKPSDQPSRLISQKA